MTSTRGKLMAKIAEELPTSGNKVTVVGVGQVGMACVVSILAKNISNEICLVDVLPDKLMGELLDLQHGSSFLNNPKIIASEDYAATAYSRVCIVTAGERRQEGESYLSLMQRNVEVFKKIIPPLVKHSPNTILLIVTNPVDIMSYVAWKLSGLPKNRIIGSGTNLDSSRFRFFLSQRLGVAPTCCHGWIIGEHGDSCVPVWSGVNIAGVRLSELNPNIGASDDPEKWSEMHKDVIGAANKVIKMKGYTAWGIGLSCATITAAIMNNSNSVFAVSTAVMGYHAINKDVFLSLPCVLNANGITSVVKQTLTPTEVELLQKSANIIYEAQKEIKI